MIWGHNILLIFFFVSFHPSGHTCHCIFSPTQCLACQLLSHAYFFRLLREESNFLCKDLRAKRHPLSLHMQCFFLPQNETKQNKNEVWDYIIHLGNEICRRVQFEANELKGTRNGTTVCKTLKYHPEWTRRLLLLTRQLSLRENRSPNLPFKCLSSLLDDWKSSPNQLCSQKWCNTSRLMKSQLAIVY